MTATEDGGAALEAIRNGRTRRSERPRLTEAAPFNPGLFSFSRGGESSGHFIPRACGSRAAIPSRADCRALQSRACIVVPGDYANPPPPPPPFWRR